MAQGFSSLKTNDLLKVQSGTVTTQTSFTVSGLTAGVKYKMVWNMQQNTSAGTFSLRINADSGSNYDYQGTIGNGGTNCTVDNAVNQSSILLHWSGATVAATYPIFYEMTFIPYATNANAVFVIGMGTYYGSASLLYNIQRGGVYKPVSGGGMTSFTIATSAGTMTGAWTLYQLA